MTIEIAISNLIEKANEVGQLEALLEHYGGRCGSPRETAEDRLTEASTSLRNVIISLVLAEREACAKIADDLASAIDDGPRPRWVSAYRMAMSAAQDIAEAIRART